MLSLLTVVIHLALLEALSNRPRIIQIQETLFSLQNGPSNPTSMQEHEIKGYTKKKEETVLL